WASGTRGRGAPGAALVERRHRRGRRAAPKAKPAGATGRSPAAPPGCCASWVGPPGGLLGLGFVLDDAAVPDLQVRQRLFVHLAILRRPDRAVLIHELPAVRGGARQSLGGVALGFDAPGVALAR